MQGLGAGIQGGEGPRGGRQERAGYQIANRFNDEFAVSVAFVSDKRVLGGMLELVTHCHYVVAAEGTNLNRLGHASTRPRQPSVPEASMSCSTPLGTCT